MVVAGVVVAAAAAAAAVVVVVVGGAMRSCPPAQLQAVGLCQLPSIIPSGVPCRVSGSWSQPSFRFDFLAQTDRSLVYRFSHLFDIYSRFYFSQYHFCNLTCAFFRVYLLKLKQRVEAPVAGGRYTTYSHRHAPAPCERANSASKLANTACHIR